MSEKKLKEIVENSLSQPHLCPGCDTVYLREDMTLYMGELFAEKYTLLCKKCNFAAEKMYPKKAI